MASLRFPFLFFQPQNPPCPTTKNASSHTFSAITAAGSVVAAAGAIIAMTQSPKNPFVENAMNFFSPNKNHSCLPMWGSISLADNSNSGPVTESRTGMSFPSIIKDSQTLLGIGLRKKAILGLKNIDVYAFGVYADDGDVKKCLAEKYGEHSLSELKQKEELKNELMENDIRMTVRLQIVYGRLSIRSVRSAFEESVGSRLQKFGGSDNKELLQRFTSLFKDDIKIPRGSIIELSRDQSYTLRTTTEGLSETASLTWWGKVCVHLILPRPHLWDTLVDGKDVGSIQSKLLCRSVLDLYIGDEPFDRKAKEDVELNLASLVQK